MVALPPWGGKETGGSDGMKPSQLPWKWLLVGLLAVLVFAIALIPWLIGDTSRFGDRVASELSAWTGGEVKFDRARARALPAGRLGARPARGAGQHPGFRGANADRQGSEGFA